MARPGAAPARPSAPSRGADREPGIMGDAIWGTAQRTAQVEPEQAPPAPWGRGISRSAAVVSAAWHIAAPGNTTIGSPHCGAANAMHCCPLCAVPGWPARPGHCCASPHCPPAGGGPPSPVMNLQIQL